ncbi:replication-relaxation family protein [Catenulispora sp. NL8]|uniref:Replication-relaxation family protein n=1 Tax=Catenulispora pinistramenti TaxID=2705254 RepID=A0ABS5KJ90_9ACTN|nr:replication-relaxation family protein [Catenulispora pinistramenti]MBS2545396.1 replication-relaxation family protein [Catenulispora pinistramenti]
MAEHRMLTSKQIARILFPRERTARERIAAMRSFDLIETFRPPCSSGTSPLHCTLTAKALRLVVGDDESAASRHRVARAGTLGAVAMALRADLAHLRGTNEVFSQLVGHARKNPGCELEAWRSEWSCARLFGGQVRPDGFGRWRDGEAWCDFFLEYDTGTETQERLLAKLVGYADLAFAADVTCPVLFWLPSVVREENLQRHLADRRSEVPVATAHGDPTKTDPAGPIWLLAGADKERLPLAALGAASVRERGGRQHAHAF